MTYKYNKVYINETYTVAGPYENDGPISKYFDKKYKRELYFGEKNIEHAEVKLLKNSIIGLLNKSHKKDSDINLLLSGDLQNQISASSYALRDFNIPFMGIYNACSTISEGLIMGSTFIESGKIKNCIVSTSSHNMVAEKQYRNPSEYGAPKPKTATFTATGGASILLSNTKSNIRIESSTIGRVIDLGVKDVNNMGAVMVPGAADTLYRHLTDLKRKPDYYDLILTGDLGMYGKEILIKYMKRVYDIDISDNYNDCGTMLYDLKKQPVFAGGSGPVCSALVVFSYILKLMKEKKLKRVLILPTGALFSPTMFFQKDSLPCISHAVSLEVDSK